MKVPLPNIPLSKKNREFLKSNFYWLYDFITDAQITRILSAPDTYKQQPLARFLEGIWGPPKGISRDIRDETFFDTERAMKCIYQKRDKYSQWFEFAIEKSADPKNYENASSALAEIRALGALLNTGLEITTVKTKEKPTPDFRLSLGTKKAWVEVTCKQLNGIEAKSLEKFNKNQEKERTSHWIYPAGRPKLGETILENVVSKIANIKPEARQANSFHPAILWLDLQDPDWRFTGADYMFPLVTYRSHFYGGPIWLAFYGWEGAPLLEAHTYKQGGGNDGVSKMRFDGLFKQKEWDAAIISIPGILVLFVSPYSKYSISKTIIKELMQIFRFSYQHSWIDWPSKILFKIKFFLAKLELKIVATMCPYRYH